jgi:FMN phosphatase YigB (HAD superfamily)
VLGAVTAAGRNNVETFEYFQPGFDLLAERERRERAGAGEIYGEADLYPDVRPTLAALQEMGLWVGIAGNQTAKAARILRDMSLPADLIATSADWGAAKPDPMFFRRIVDVAPGPNACRPGSAPRDLDQTLAALQTDRGLRSHVRAGAREPGRD